MLCTYGYRMPDHGIRAVVSDDHGATWATDAALIVRDDLPNRDLGYPCSIRREDGSNFRVYYGQDRDGVTSIQSTVFRL